MFATLLLLLQNTLHAVDAGTGREWMVFTAILLPLLLLILIIWAGSKSTV